MTFVLLHYFIFSTSTMAMSKFWSFQSDANNDDLPACLSNSEYLVQEVALSPLVKNLHYGVFFKDNGTFAIHGTVQYFNDNNMFNVAAEFDSFAINSIAEDEMMVYNQELDETALFRITAKWDNYMSMIISFNAGN